MIKSELGEWDHREHKLYRLTVNRLESWLRERLGFRRTRQRMEILPFFFNLVMYLLVLAQYDMNMVSIRIIYPFDSG